MRLRAAILETFLVCALGVTQCHFDLHAAETHSPAHGLAVRTNFISDAPLSSSELKQVIVLAKKCGITNPVEVRTFQWLPNVDMEGNIAKGIEVKSAEQIEGRNLRFETIIINKLSWRDSSPSSRAKRIGEFWAEEKESVLKRSYQFGGENVRVTIRAGVEVKTADEVISLLNSKKVRFDNEFSREQFGHLKGSVPESIHNNQKDGTHGIYFSGQYVMRLRVRNGYLEVVSFSGYDI